MINKFLENLKERNLRKQLRKHYNPDITILRSSKEYFMNQLNAGNQIRIPVHHHIIQWRYALVTILIMASTTVGVATFADQSNVPADHPLYQLKLVSEKVRLGLSTPTKKVKLHEQLAVRRLKEFKETKEVKNVSNGHGAIIKKDNLANEFEKEANRTIDQAEHLNFKKDQRRTLCKNLLDSVDNIKQNKHLERIQDRCQVISDDPN